MRLAAAAAAVLLSAAAAPAATIRVPGDQPTVQAGVTAAAPGDTVLVSRGIYPENVVIGTQGITLKGSGAIIDGNLDSMDGVCLTVNGADVVISGMTFRNGTNQVLANFPGLRLIKCTFIEANAVAVDSLANGTTLDGCRFQGPSGLAFRMAGTGAVVRKCTFRHCGNGGVEITGDGALVEACAFAWVDDNESVQITGDGARVMKNRFSLCDRDCIRISGAVAAAAVVEGNRADRVSARLVNVTGGATSTGNGCVVRGNSASYTLGGIAVTGNNCTIQSNRVSNCGNTAGIALTGDNLTVGSNTVTTTWNDADGFTIASDTGAGGGTVTGNRATDCAGYGFRLDNVFNVNAASCTATRCADDNRAGFRLVGDGNTVENCSATESDALGFSVDGNGNSLTSCKATKAAVVGFLLVSGGNGNTLTDCTASGAGLEGIDNQATGTDLVRGRYQGARFDVANDVTGGATFVDPTLDGVSFRTGGAMQQSQF